MFIPTTFVSVGSTLRVESEDDEPDDACFTGGKRLQEMGLHETCATKS